MRSTYYYRRFSAFRLFGRSFQHGDEKVVFSFRHKGYIPMGGVTNLNGKLYGTTYFWRFIRKRLRSGVFAEAAPL
jgi:hypothetical protein